MPELWLVCEGDSDLRVLSSVLTQVLAADILVKPAGGAGSAPSVADYLARTHKVDVAYVLDRDYRRKEVCEDALTDGKRCFMWRRHAIESYLLEPVVVAQALRSLKLSVAALPGGGSKRVQGLPDDIATLAKGLRSCASKRGPAEAGHLALQRLWEDLSETASRVQMRAPPVLGTRAPDPAACKQALVEEAARLATKGGETAGSTHLTPASISSRYEEHLAIVSSDSYLAGLCFLEEFNAKELLGAFLTWLQEEYQVSLKRKTLVEELEKAVPLVYGADRSVYGTDDFCDLANGVRRLAGLPPIR